MLDYDIQNDLSELVRSIGMTPPLHWDDAC